MTRSQDAGGDGHRTTARYVSMVTTPYLTVPAFILLAGLGFVDRPVEVLLYGAIAVGFTVVVPLAYAEHLRRIGRVDSVHIFDRRARLAPLALTGASTMAGLTILWLIDAPEGIVRLALLLFLMAAATLAATAVLKVSGHVSSWSAGSTVLVVLYGAQLVPVVLMALPIAWARWRLRRHDLRELVAGALYGVVSAAALSWLVGLW